MAQARRRRSGKALNNIVLWNGQDSSGHARQDIGYSCNSYDYEIIGTAQLIYGYDLGSHSVFDDGLEHEIVQLDLLLD